MIYENCGGRGELSGFGGAELGGFHSFDFPLGYAQGRLLQGAQGWGGLGREDLKDGRTRPTSICSQSAGDAARFA